MHEARTMQHVNLPEFQGDASIYVAIKTSDRKTTRQVARARCRVFAKERDVTLCCFVASLVIIVIEKVDCCEQHIRVPYA
jgi:hypothetical protein